MSKDVLVAIGEALIDMIPDKKGCEFGEVTAFAPKLGGAPANVCGAYSKLGGMSRMLTQLGDDPFGHKILGELCGCGVDVSCISLTDKANTALAFVSLEADGNRTFSFYRKPSADMLYEAECVRKEYFDDAYALHFCSVSLGDFPMKEAHHAAISEMHRRGGIVSFDPNLRPQLWSDSIAMINTVREFLPKADIIKVSDEEIELITGEKDIEKALPKLFTGSVKMVVYTCGKNGAHAYTRSGACAKCEARKVKVLDTTGAGDGFTGAFLYKLHELGANADTLSELSEETLAGCLDFSNRFCAVSVTKKGAIASYPDTDEMRNIDLNQN